MKFLVSTTQSKLANKHGQWYWEADSGCRTMIKSDQVIIYGGYTIQQPIEELLNTDPHLVKNKDGAFFVVILTPTGATVYVDYFSQEKIVYKYSNGVEITNRPWLLTLSREDIDREELESRISFTDKQKAYRSTDEFETSRGMQLDWVSRPERYTGPGAKQFQHNINCTIWRDTWILVPDHSLAVTGTRCELVRINDTIGLIRQAWNRTQAQFTEHEALMEHIHTCMSSHSDVIKQNFKSDEIVLSVSDGIDSVLQEQYFTESPRASYTLWPLNSPFENKMQTLAGSNRQDMMLMLFDLAPEKIKQTATKFLRDSSLFYLDCVPSFKQMRTLHGTKPKLILYGQNGDQCFMHRPAFLKEYILHQQLDNDGTFEERMSQFENELRKHHGRYCSRVNIWENESNTWQEAFPKYTEQDMKNFFDNNKGRTAKEVLAETFSKMLVPVHYNRDVGCNSDILTTSLYSDSRFFYSVFGSSREIIEGNLQDVKTQRMLLTEKFNYNSFQTPCKDGEEYNVVHVIKSFYIASINHAVKDNLAELRT